MFHLLNHPKRKHLTVGGVGLATYLAIRIAATEDLAAYAVAKVLDCVILPTFAWLTYLFAKHRAPAKAETVRKALEAHGIDFGFHPSAGHPSLGPDLARMPPPSTPADDGLSLFDPESTTED